MVVKEMKVLLGNKMDARILDVCSGTGTIGIAVSSCVKSGHFIIKRVNKSPL